MYLNKTIQKLYVKCLCVMITIVVVLFLSPNDNKKNFVIFNLLFLECHKEF